MLAACEIEEIEVPASVDAASFADYAGHLAVRNRNKAAVLGASAAYVDPAEMLPYFQDQKDARKRLFVARRGGGIVGQALLEHDQSDERRVGWVFGGVLAEERGQGVGTCLFDHMEREAIAAGCETSQSFVLHATAAGDAQVVARSGVGALPAADPGVRFVARRGYELEQVTRWNVLDLPVDDALLTSLQREAAAHAGNEYRLHAWMGPSPDAWPHELAILAAAMEQDVPRAGLDIDATTWDAESVRRHEAVEEAGGRRLLTAAVEHVPTGQLAGYTRYSLPGDPARPVTQTMTLVLQEHRGRRLGMLLKARNLFQLRDVFPEARLVLTGTAAENEHILDINQQLGFRTVGYTGAWKKDMSLPRAT